MEIESLNRLSLGQRLRLGGLSLSILTHEANSKKSIYCTIICRNPSFSLDARPRGGLLNFEVLLTGPKQMVFVSSRRKRCHTLCICHACDRGFGIGVQMDC